MVFERFIIQKMIKFPLMNEYYYIINNELFKEVSKGLFINYVKWHRGASNV